VSIIVDRTTYRAGQEASGLIGTWVYDGANLFFFGGEVSPKREIIFLKKSKMK
jgi:hypothetical protein